MPINEALEVIEEQLKKDETLDDRTTLSPLTITDLIKFCMSSTYFGYEGKIYKQLEGAPMGSHLSPIIADLYMEQFERDAIQ